MNLYGFIGNDGVNRWDFMGMVGSIYVPGSSQGWGPNTSGPTNSSARTGANNPTPLDNNTIFTQSGGTTDQTAWFDSNYAGEVSRGKSEIIKKINDIIEQGCPGQRRQIPNASETGYASDSWLDGVSVGSFAFQVTGGRPVKWDGFKWSWEAELVISDTVGFDWGDSPEENIFAVLFGWNVGISTQIYRASWQIKGSGECECEFPYEKP
jgi:hypothetical protein